MKKKYFNGLYHKEEKVYQWRESQGRKSISMVSISKKKKDINW